MSIKLVLKLFYFLGALIFFASSNTLHADTPGKLTETLIINSALKHYPEISAYYENINAAEGSVTAAEGFFDLRLTQDYTRRNRAPYRNQTYDLMLEKNVGVLGGTVYGGYRNSTGSVPFYKEELQDSVGGEYRLGARLSLLRHSGIDEPRLKLMLSQLAVQTSKIEYERIKMQIKRDASIAYWQWVFAGRIYKIYDALYKLSLTRQDQLTEQFKKGAVARIIIDENKKNILRRHNLLLNSEQNFQNSAINLSLFWRDVRGMPVIPPKTQLPDLQISLKDLPDEQLKKDITWAQMNRPEIKLLEMEKNQEQLQLKYAKNLYKPQLDVDVGVAENANNSSVNPNRGNDPNNYVNLNFSVPLEQRKAKGSTQQAEFRLMSLEHNQQLAKEQITTELEQIKVQINNLLVTHGNLEQEVELAGLLEKAERERFSHGASNFFLVNLREQDTAESAAALNEIAKQYKVALADYQFAVFDTKI